MLKDEAAELGDGMMSVIQNQSAKWQQMGVPESKGVYTLAVLFRN